MSQYGLSGMSDTTINRAHREFVRIIQCILKNDSFARDCFWSVCWKSDRYWSQSPFAQIILLIRIWAFYWKLFSSFYLSEKEMRLYDVARSWMERMWIRHPQSITRKVEVGILLWSKESDCGVYSADTVFNERSMLSFTFHYCRISCHTILLWWIERDSSDLFLQFSFSAPQ